MNCKGECCANTPKGPTEIEVKYSKRQRDTCKIRENQQENVKITADVLTRESSHPKTKIEAL